MRADRERGSARASILRTLLGVAALAGLGVLGPGSAFADDLGAPAAPAYPAVQLPAGTCVGSGCHESVKVDPKHQGKQVTCVKCHSNVTDNRKPHKGTLDALAAPQMCGQSDCHETAVKNAASGLHKDLMCESCHDSLHGDFKPEQYGNCSECHDEQVNAFKDSVHGQPHEGKKPVDCNDCHGDLHDPKAKADPLSPMSKILQVTTCSECHDKEFVRAYRTSVHGQGVLRSGLSVAPTCVDCHGSHGIDPVKDPRSRVSRNNITTTCGACHTFIVSRWKTSAHGQRWLEEQAIRNGQSKGSDRPISKTAGERPREAPVCTTCHSGHRTLDPMIYHNDLQMAERCGECHKRHNESYRDSFHGKATRLGYAAATCAACHTPHEMRPTADPRSSVNPKNLQKTCGACHQPINAAFVKFDAHMNARDRWRNPSIHFVWLFMTGLLVSVLLFFAFHTLLWLQRALVALARNEFPKHDLRSPEWVRRFKPVHMGIHVTVIVTFLLLSATGLPLKFSAVEWAKPIEALFGGLHNARWLHRFAGVVTFGYAGAFLFWIIREVAFRGRGDILWGWRSMVPSLKDLTDLLANLRWFLYLGPPPKLDRWAYWEKFDFFAVFWGIPVIGLSGLALWMPLEVTRVLPGWALNLAYLIHSDEALLATGFIFYFHLFHTHLRPESFPLDTVVFLGGMPIERLREERPVEYARLVKSGEIEQLRMPAPSEAAIRRARTFGFTTLTIGVVLGTFLIIAGLATLFK